MLVRIEVLEAGPDEVLMISGHLKPGMPCSLHLPLVAGNAHNMKLDPHHGFVGRVKAVDIKVAA